MSAVWELDLPSTEKLVLLGFADHANDGGLCFPSVRRIAWKCGISERSVQRMIAGFKSIGLLDSVGNTKGGRNRPTTYCVRPEKGANLSPFKISTGVQSTQKGCHPQRERVTPTAPESSLTVIRTVKPRRESRAARNHIDEEINRRREAKQKRLKQQDDLQRELMVGSGPR